MWADVLYVAPYNYPGEIDRVNSAGAVSVFANLPADAFNPEGIAFDGTGNLYVANDSTATISKITSSGTATLFATVPGSSPVGLAFDASGNLYMADTNHDWIDKIDPAGTATLFAALPNGSLPIGLAFDSSGNLYTANANTDEISKITSTGTVSHFATLPAGSSPFGLAFDRGGDLYVTEIAGRIDKIDAGGAVSPFVLLPGTPYALAFDSSGNLYASQADLGQISKITSAGVVSIFASDIVSPTFIAVTDDAGHPLTLPPVSVPEPSSIVLALGFLGLVVFARHLNAVV